MGTVPNNAVVVDPVQDTDVSDVGTFYYYNGQMPMETAHVKADNSVTVIRQGLGAGGRGNRSSSPEG